jgi:hypothetical protein
MPRGPGLPFARLAVAVLAVVAIAVPANAGGSGKACGKIVNPYPGTRYEGVDLKHIRAEGVSCDRARRVTKKAHRKALGQPLPPDGIRRFEWRHWSVRGNLIPNHDRYVAKRGDKRVRWTF